MDEATFAFAVAVFAALAHPTRLRIVCAPAQGETNPTCLAVLAAVGVPAVSQHLAKLPLAGVCRPHRDGQRVWYELVDAGVRDLVGQLLAAAGPTASTTTDTDPT